MYFNETISFIPTSDKLTKVIRRTAVRAVIIRNEKILMVRSNQGYYKLPGGGVEADENHEEALIREVAEETGYVDCKVGEELGRISELRPDQFAEDMYFHMDSHHFLCELTNNERKAQSLAGYELQEGYAPVWVPIQEAINFNKLIFEKDESQKFLLRENLALHKAKKLFPAILTGLN